MHDNIPMFSLYGEPSDRHQSDFLHIEDIHVRSARNNWFIKPHRHNTLFQLLALEEGEVTALLDDWSHTIEGPCVIIVPVGVVHGFRFSPDCKGVVLSLSMQQGNDIDSPVYLREFTRPAVLSMDQAQDYPFIRDCLKRLRYELTAIRPDQAIALTSLVKLLFVAVRRSMTDGQYRFQSPGHSLNLSELFRQQVETNFSRHLTIGDYARALNVSVSTLNRACLEHLGMSSKKYLQSRIHTEARRLLTYTSDNLDTLADRLGYKDAAYFSRVFRNQEGHSPRDYRKKVGERIELINQNSF